MIYATSGNSAPYFVSNEAWNIKLNDEFTNAVGADASFSFVCVEEEPKQSAETPIDAAAPTWGEWDESYGYQGHGLFFVFFVLICVVFV